jgi:hypothetical protein
VGVDSNYSFGPDDFGISQNNWHTRLDETSGVAGWLRKNGVTLAR